MSNRLVMGTAQLGMSYGINNKVGQPDDLGALELVRTAWDRGIHEFDTAQAYGDSEDILGVALESSGLSRLARVITKLDPKLDCLDTKVLTIAVERSLRKLKVLKLSGLMLHDESWLGSWEKGLGAFMGSMVRNGMVEQVGVSVYAPDKALEALNKSEVMFVQIPSNMLDQRFEKAGVFALAQKKGKKVYIRSVFLQGLMVMDPDVLPENMDFARGALLKIRALAQELKLSVEAMALGYVLGQWPQARIVIGVETPAQVLANVAMADKALPENIRAKISAAFADTDQRIINPSLWLKRV